ncbi:AarF/ABC1/UbiB kinase family protein [Sphingomonas sp. S6]|jgi:ubiquinone biosynthesis protein|uniref:ABC1 kinase family protein n=1 Tax=Sphingomonas sp. S6 TaxID=3368600 RepID=UPI000F9A1E62|nr:AarF/UbiB family protein [uncultured Sphingomonas sp.]RTL21006.1 MAG: AarF/ABC1/UbiB kinase family protein [Sphingomonadaceae bacterium]
MIKTLLVAGRDRNRLGEILHVASRFGLGVILQRLGIERTADVGDDRPDADAMPLPRRTRLALEELGPTFVKLGQILATRGDLLSDEWITELEQLHSRAPTVAFEHLRPAVEEALGQPPETAFASFDPAPLAAASMAQVHRATLTDGREVVLKIRRPGIRPRMEADLRLIAQLATIAESASAEARRFAPTAMMRQLAEAISEELDFTTEGRNADRLRADFANEPRVVVPDIHWAWTSETVLVMDYIDGVPPRDREELRAAGIDPAAIAALGADMVLDMVLVNGRFHGDPHPGNLLCLPGNRIALLDLGMIGHVSPRRREEFISFVQALNAGDPAQLADVLATWSAGSGTPRERIQAAAERLIIRHGGGRLVLSAMVADFFPLLRAEGMTMPADLLLIFKALVTVDGVLARIEPDFDLSAAMQRASLRILAARLAPGYWTPTLQALAWELGKIGDDAPRLLRAAIRRLEDAPPTPSPNNGQADAILASGRWIAAAIIFGSLLIAGVRFLA